MQPLGCLRSRLCFEFLDPCRAGWICGAAAAANETKKGPQATVWLVPLSGLFAISLWLCFDLTSVLTGVDLAVCLRDSSFLEALSRNPPFNFSRRPYHCSDNCPWSSSKSIYYLFSGVLIISIFLIDVNAFLLVLYFPLLTQALAQVRALEGNSQQGAGTILAGYSSLGVYWPDDQSRVSPRTRTPL